MVEDPRRWNGAAARRGHRVQFTVKMLPINADRGAELVPLGALIGLQGPGRGFWTHPKGPFGTMNGDVPRCGECHCLGFPPALVDDVQVLWGNGGVMDDGQFSAMTLNEVP